MRIWIVTAVLLGAVSAFAQQPDPKPEDPPPEPKKLRPITGVEEVPPPPPPATNWAWWIVPGVVVCASAALWYRRRRPPEEPPPMPDEWACGELAKLERTSLLATGAAERYHTILSDIVRRYLEMRYDLRASRQTTPEFLKAMAGSPHLNTEQQQILKGLLENCDLAKFAGVKPSTETSRELAAQAKTLIEQTKKPPDLPVERNGTVGH